MGRTYKDESVGADGKFRNRQRNHERRTLSRNTRATEVHSDSFDYDEDLDDKKLVSNKVNSDEQS